MSLIKNKSFPIDARTFFYAYIEHTHSLLSEHNGVPQGISIGLSLFMTCFLIAIFSLW